MKAGNIIMVLLLIVVVSMLVIPSSPICILPKKQQQVGCMSDDDCSGNQYCDQSDNMCKLSNQLTEDEELLNERRAANNAVAAAASEDIERYTEHLDASLNYCTNQLLSDEASPKRDDFPDYLLDGYNQDSSDNDILHVTLMKTETEMLNIIAQLIRKISKIYNNNKNYNGVSKKFTRSYNNLIDVFSTFTKINSSEVQDIGITCNIQNYVNRSSFAGPIFNILFDDIGDMYSQDPQICFESEQDSIDMGNSYTELIKMVFYSIGLVHKILQVYQLENLVYDPNGLKIKTNILNEMSMKAPIAMGTYAYVSGIDNGTFLRELIGQYPYEVGGAYIARNGKIILTPETEPNLECDINPENMYSSDPPESMYYLTGDDNIDNQLNNWHLNSEEEDNSSVVAEAVASADKDDKEVDDWGNVRIRVGIDKMRAYVQEREAAGEGWSTNLFSLEHVYKDGTPVINNEKAFVTESAEPPAEPPAEPRIRSGESLQRR